VIGEELVGGAVEPRPGSGGAERVGWAREDAVTGGEAPSGRGGGRREDGAGEGGDPAYGRRKGFPAAGDLAGQKDEAASFVEDGRHVLHCGVGQGIAERYGVDADAVVEDGALRPRTRRRRRGRGLSVLPCTGE